MCSRPRYASVLQSCLNSSLLLRTPNLFFNEMDVHSSLQVFHSYSLTMYYSAKSTASTLL